MPDASSRFRPSGSRWRRPSSPSGSGTAGGRSVSASSFTRSCGVRRRGDERSGDRGADAAPEDVWGRRMMTARPAIVLLSGGLDSATCLLVARDKGFEVHALSFDYGQRHAVELDSARAIAERYGARQHRIVRLDFPGEGASALTDPTLPVPRHRLGEPAIPTTYVPARNTLFLAHALAWAEVLGAHDIFIGANAIDYSGYPDCR